MRAIVISQPGGPEVLTLRDVPMPEPQRGEVRVRIHASAINRADLLQRAGMYPAPADSPQDIPGLEFAGVVDAVGEFVTNAKKGDRVFGLVGGGAYAEYLVTHARAIAKMPDAIGDKPLSFEDAAAIPEAFITAYDAIVTQAGLAAGETLLVHAAGSGVGTAAVQIARAIGARSIGTARTSSKLDRAKSLGMDEGVVVSDGKFSDTVMRATGGRGVDVVLELVGGAYLPENLKCIALRARIAIVGHIAGSHADLDLNALMRKRASMFGTMLRARPLEEKIAATREFERHIVPLLSRGAILPVVEKIFPLERAGDAHAFVASNETFGKVVLAI
jgi:NADPH2:quinone reductase